MGIRHYYLGCPIWSYKEWVGELFTRDAKPADFLRQYTRVFNTVEGNTTFYGLPSPQTVARWREDTSPGFHFCFKFPRTISHERRLRHVAGETTEFFQRLAPLHDRLGPLLLQLPPSFSPEDLVTLQAFLASLPADHRYAVEVRHLAFFSDPEIACRFDDMLREREMDRVIFDTIALRTADAKDEAVSAAQRRKPDLPLRIVATAQQPFYRFVAHPQVEANLSYLANLADVVAQWLQEDRTPYVFMHSPHDFYAPRLARHFHRLLQERSPVGNMPSWPAEEEGPAFTQLGLF